MTPHLMEQIRDSQGDLVKAYQPKPWLQPISPQTAATLTTFMKGGGHLGYGRQGRLPGQLGRGGQDRDGPDRSFGPDPQYTDDWMIAFAPVGNTKVAIAVVLPDEPGKCHRRRVLGADREADPGRRAGGPGMTPWIATVADRIRRTGPPHDRHQPNEER